MSQRYGIKRIHDNRRPDARVVREIVRWGRIMGSLKMAPFVEGKGWAGNIGYRENNDVWVTRSGSEIGALNAEDLIGLSSGDGGVVFWGAETSRPTSEWEIHWSILSHRPEINAVLHGHDALVLEAAERMARDCPEAALTKGVTESGSAEFRDEILDILTDTNMYLIGREHGFFALGRTMDDAGLVAIQFRSRATEIVVGETRYEALLHKYHLKSHAGV